MYQPRQRGIRGVCLVSDVPTRCVAGFGGLRSIRRHRAILVTQAEWQKGGTVIPPCVFQGSSTKNPLNKGSPSDFPHGLRALAGARAHSRTPKQLESSWSAYYKRFSRCGFIPHGTSELKTQISKKFTRLMEKNNLKLLSVRIEPDTLVKIDAFCKNHTYWKRNAVINQILTTIFTDFDDRQVYDMVRRPWFWQNLIKAEYEITKDLKVKGK